jgi:lysophospholipase L1-like esterase
MVLLLLMIGGIAIILNTGFIHRDTTAASTAHVGKFRYLALGDSYTIGEGVLVDDRWPMQLADQLRRGGVDLSDPMIIARTGWTTGDLLAAMDEAKPTGPFDLVTVLIGVNNQYQGRSRDVYRQQFVELMKRAIALANGKASHVVVLSIPDWGVSPFARQRDGKQIAAEIDQFNVINLEETKKLGARHVDITPGTRRAAEHLDWFGEDGLHPTRPQYKAWTDETINTARAALTE